MPFVPVRSRIASTLPVAKYGGVRVGVGVLRHMVEVLNAGALPMTFDHSALEPLSIRNVRAELVPLGDGEFAVDATYEMDEAQWASVQQRFAALGVAGGMSYTFGAPQIPAADGAEPVIVIAADAAAFSDDERVDAQRVLASRLPTRVDRLYEFSALADVARIILQLWPTVAVGLGVHITGSFLWDALKGMFRRDHARPTVIEIQRYQADGSRTVAVVSTSDADIARHALTTLAETQAVPVTQYDPEKKLWLPPGGVD